MANFRRVAIAPILVLSPVFILAIQYNVAYAAGDPDIKPSAEELAAKQRRLQQEKDRRRSDIRKQLVEAQALEEKGDEALEYGKGRLDSDDIEQTKASTAYQWAQNAYNYCQNLSGYGSNCIGQWNLAEQRRLELNSAIEARNNTVNSYNKVIDGLKKVRQKIESLKREIDELD